MNYVLSRYIREIPSWDLVRKSKVWLPLLRNVVGYIGATVVILGIVVAIAAIVAISWLLCGAAMAF